MNRFVQIEVKRQAYLGRPTIALITSDYTKKLNQKIDLLKQMEQLQAAR